MPTENTELIEATFLRRPNRFLVHARLEDGTVVHVFMPNPGRMGELLYPGVRLTIAAHAAKGPARKTAYTCLAVEREGAPVFLHTHWNNAVAEGLLNAGQIPGWEDARVVRREVPIGHSRFDFLVRHKRREWIVEVKSVTLFHRGVAMFPDAITDRGRRHLLELAELKAHGTPTAVIFLIHTPNARWFMPDFHTDLAFSQAFLQVCDKVEFVPVAIKWDAGLSQPTVHGRPDIPIAHITSETEDRGGLIILRRHCDIVPDWTVELMPVDAELTRAMRQLESASSGNAETRVYPVRSSQFRDLMARWKKSAVRIGPVFDEAAFQEWLLAVRLRPPS